VHYLRPLKRLDRGNYYVLRAATKSLVVAIFSEKH